MSGNMVRCDSPASSENDVAVSYSNDGHNFVNASIFTFFTPAAVSDMEPRFWPKRGKTEVRILGEDFSSDGGIW